MLLMMQAAALLAGPAAAEFSLAKDVGLPLMSAIVGGIISFFLTRWSARRSEREQHYTHADAQYAAVLNLYLDHPEFSDRTSTRDFARAFSGAEALRYGAFASLVHNFLETLFDLFHDAASDEIDDRWTKVFAYHAHMHAPWLLAHSEQYEPGYVAFIERKYMNDGWDLSPRPR